MGLSMGQKRRKRRFWDDDEKREIVAQTRVPGVSVSRVARRYDVNANLVFKWLRDRRFKLAAEVEPTTSFLALEVIPEPATRDVVPHVSSAKIEIVLSNGHRLSVSGAFDPDALSRLVRGLSR